MKFYLYNTYIGYEYGAYGGGGFGAYGAGNIGGGFDAMGGADMFTSGGFLNESANSASPERKVSFDRFANILILSHFIEQRSKLDHRTHFEAIQRSNLRK